jgi:hypothetical protein
MKTISLTFFAALLALLCGKHPVGAEDINTVLGMNKRVRFVSRGPELNAFSYAQRIETIAIPDKLLIPLQAANEGLAFYAAYRDKNYPAMAAVGATSMWGGTLRRGIDAVSGSSNEASFEDLATLTDREIAILGYLWDTEGKAGRDLYRDLGKDGRWTDLSSELSAMQKRKLVRKTRSGLEDLFHANVAPTEVCRAVIATGNPKRITTVLLAIGRSKPDLSSEASGEQYSVGDRFEAQ